MDQHILGIDVSKLQFNVCLVRPDGKLRHRVFTNNTCGFTQLSQWLKKQHVAQLHAVWKPLAPTQKPWLWTSLTPVTG
jgi:hypothetical protein